MIDTPLVAGQAYGLRTWRVTSNDGREALTGPHQVASWPLAGGWLEAICVRPGGHAAPAPDCACGVHAWHPSRAAAQRVLSARWLVPGIVEGRGVLEVHLEGFRAHEARPHTLLAAPGRNGRQIARLAEIYGAEVVEVRGPDDVVAYCRSRGLGFDETGVADLVGPVETQRGREVRRHRRRIDALRVACALLVAALLCVIGLAISGEEPSGRILNGRAGQIRTP